MGAGSIGSVVGGLLHLGGHNVFLVGKGEHIKAIKERNLEIHGLWGDFLIEDIKATDSVSEVLESNFNPEWIILSVKSYDTEKALEDLSSALNQAKGILSLQNGLGNIEAIEKAAPGKAVGGRVIFGARTPEPGIVEVTVCADDVLLGKVYDGPAEVPLVCEAFAKAKIPCRHEEKIVSYIWDKVLYNVCLNALATTLKTNYGSIGGNEETWKIIEGLTFEFYNVARLEKVRLISPTPEDYLERLRNQLLPPTKNHRSSMQEDIEMGRKTEIESLNGRVWSLGRKHGIETPFNEALTRIIRFLEKNHQVS